MTDDRKRRSDAWGTDLPEETQWKVYDRMRKFPWYDVREWIEAELSVPPPSRSALYRFVEHLREHETEYLLRQRLLAQGQLQRELETVGAPDPERLAQVLGNDVIAARAVGDEKAVERAVRVYRAVASIVGDSAELALKRQAEARQIQELALAREKFEAAERRARQADRAEEVLKSDLTAEEKDRRYREIFGMQ